MSIEEANKLFVLCGGELNEDNLEDYICKNALRDGDDIMFFIDQFNEYVQKYSKGKKTNRLSKLSI